MKHTIATFATGLKSLPLNLVWRWPRMGISTLWGAIKASARGIARGTRWSWREANYARALFFSLSRTFLSADGLVAITAMLFLFGYLFSQGRPISSHVLQDLGYRLISVLMILFGMNLIPRERDRNTLELMWSQPISRGGLVFMQLLVLTIWLGIFLYGTLAFYGRFKAIDIHTGAILLMTLSTGFAVGLIAVLTSTFCRQGIATGIVSALIVGAHYVWIPRLGPIVLFMNPFQENALPGEEFDPRMIAFNRVFVLILIICLLDYLIRRLRKTARWFT